MPDSWFAFVIVGGVAFAMTFFLTPIAHRVGVQLDIVDKPSGRRLHEGIIPRTGGLAMSIAFIIAIIAAQFMPIERTDSNEVIRFLGLLLGSIFISVVGFLDDRYELSAIWLYTAQLVAGSIAIVFLIFIETFNNPFSGQSVEPFPYIITVTVTLFWIGLIINTVNFLDGSDGLAAGVVAIAALMIFIHSAFRLNQVSVSLLALALLGTTLGFLPYNFHPAKIFMGGGAYFLGYVLAVLSIIGGAKIATILLVMGLPLMDAAWQASSRLLRGANPMKGDRGHLHFRLIDRGVSPKWIAFGYYSFCAVFGIIALTTASQLFKFVTVIVMIGITIIVFAAVSWRTQHPVQSKES